MTSTERLNQQLRDSIKKEDSVVCITQNPRGLPDRLVSAIISAERCPMCLGRLGNETVVLVGTTTVPMKCVDCNYDASSWFNLSKAKHDRAWDHREG